MSKVVKFGGSSLASAEQFKKVGNIIRADKERKYVVPSAPGKRFSDDTKVTDMLYACYDLADQGKNFKAELDAIKARYQEIIDGLQLDLDLVDEFKTIEKNFKAKAGSNYAASRGEYLNGIIMANYLGYDFIDAATVIFFDENGEFDAAKTNEVLRARLAESKEAVVPGFYGAMPDGTVKTFSRGGSDITGSIVAKAAKADVYENWTDVSGILMADPRIVENPRPIERITYNELRELSYMGAQVLHEASVFPVRQADIPLNIRNTNDPGHPGTLIREHFEDELESEKNRFITGIAGRRNFSIITMAKNGLSSSIGSLRRVLEVFERHNLNVEYTPSGIDSVSLVVQSGKAASCLYSILGELQKEFRPDKLQVAENISIVAAVGRKMAFRPGISGKIFAALGENGISIRMISQGPEELNIIVGVDNADFEKTVRVLYESFVR